MELVDWRSLWEDGNEKALQIFIWINFL